MFIGPTDGKKKASVNTGWDVVSAYMLVAMNLVFQGVLLYMIFQEVVVSNVEWQNGIMKLGNGDGVGGLFSDVKPGCNDGGALCFDDHGNFSCAPPSVQLTGRWKELDTNADGIWTRKEVVAARKSLKCKYSVDPVEVFDVMINMLRLRSNLIWIHPEVQKGEGIHLPYFTYAMADLVMCGYRSKDMCGNLLKQGFFHAPLKYGTAPRVGTSIDSALDYCNKLLEPGGTCETLLPSTYAVWKIQSGSECGGASYEKFTYTNPGNGVTKSLLAVDYGARQDYELSQDLWFRIFKGIMLVMWILLLSSEYKEIVKYLTLCARFPSADEFGDDAVLVERDPADPEDVRYQIRGITSSHRRSIVVLSLFRFLVTCVLLAVGISYLIKTIGYADLIMNGVALVFIAEISNVLYGQVLREEVKDQTGDIKPMKVAMFGSEWLNRRPALIDIITVAVILVAVYAMMEWQLTNLVVPVHNALQCACTGTGSTCVEAHKFNYDFWHNYWLHGVPSIYKEVAKLKKGAAAASAAYISIAATRGVGTDDASIRTRLEKAEELNSQLEQRFKKIAEGPQHASAPLQTSGAILTQTKKETKIVEHRAEHSAYRHQPEAHVSSPKEQGARRKA